MLSTLSPSLLLRLLGLSLCLLTLTPTPVLAQSTDGSVTLGATVPPPYQVGQTIDLIGIFRSGAGDALDATLTVTATAGVTFLQVIPVHPTQPFGCTLDNPQQVTCSRDVIRGSSEITVPTRFDQGGTQSITATAGQSNPDPNPNNNTVTATFQVNGGQPQPGAISGTKWHDLDQDGQRDGNEPSLSGWTIYVDENGNGQRDGGEPAATTGNNGSYQIDNLDPDTYTVREVLQDGWEQTFPSGGAHTVTVEADETTSGVDFGNYEMVMMADLGLMLSATPTSAGKVAEDDTLGVTVGDTLAVEAVVDNNGPDDAEAVVITVRLDGDGHVFIDTESIDDCGGRGSPNMPDGQTVTWDVNQVDDGETVRCGLRLFTVERGETTIDGTVTSTTDDPDPSNNNDGIFTVVEEQKLADLVVEKFVSPDSVFVGDTLTYTVSILNRGPDDAPNVRFSDLVFNDSLTFIPASVPAGCALTQNNGQLDCTLAAIAAGQTVSVSYRALTKLAGTVTNLVTNLSSDLPDPDQSSNTTSVKAFVSGGADLSVEKIAAFVDPNITGVAAVIAYTVTVTNNGPETAFLVETDDLVFADSLEFVAASVPQNCTLGTATDDDTGLPLSTMTCRLAAILEVGESRSVTYEAVTKQAGTVSNEVEVKAAAPRDLNPSDNIAVVTTVVEGQTTIDFTLDASASATSVTEGDPVRFTFSCTANEPAGSCQVAATTNDDWTNPNLQGTFVIADGDTMAVAEGDTMTVEVDPEGFPSGTTRITYTFNGGYTDGGETYMGSFTLEADKPNPNATVRFEASAPNNDDPNEDDDIIEILVNIDALATAIEQDPDAVPQAFHLHGNYPNPFNPETVIQFDLKGRARVQLQIFNVLGQVVATLVDEEMATGSYRSVFDARGLPSGTYFYRITAGSFTEARPMVLLK